MKNNLVELMKEIYMKKIKKIKSFVSCVLLLSLLSVSEIPVHATMAPFGWSYDFLAEIFTLFTEDGTIIYSGTSAGALKWLIQQGWTWQQIVKFFHSHPIIF